MVYSKSSQADNLSYCLNDSRSRVQSKRANPPLLTKGMTPLEREGVRIGLDWLSLSVNKAYSEKLKAVFRKSDISKPLYANGFYKHEWRDTIGGQCQRHYSPRVKSKRMGSDYELWS